ncbi:hypothetical protein SAMN04490220_1010, partial [Rhodococcus jostii]
MTLKRCWKASARRVGCTRGLRSLVGVWGTGLNVSMK